LALITSVILFGLDSLNTGHLDFPIFNPPFRAEKFKSGEDFQFTARCGSVHRFVTGL